MNWRRSEVCWVSWGGEGNEYDRILAAGDRSSWMDIDPFHLAGNVDRIVGGRRPADVKWSVDRRALCGGLCCVVFDVGLAARHDGVHQPFRLRQNSERSAVWICRAAGIAATADQKRAGNGRDSDRSRNGPAAALVISTVWEPCDFSPVGCP